MGMHKATRRDILKTAIVGGAGLAAPSILTRRAFAADSITVADVGGATSDAVRKAFCEPFTKETGIKIALIAHDADPVTQFKLNVDSKSYLWDVCMMVTDHLMRLKEGKVYVEPLNIKDETGDMDPTLVTEHWVGFSVFGILMAYRTDKYGADGPKTWADFFDAKKIPGRRGLYRNGWGMIEMALLADGVAKDKLYPLDVDRAFKAMDRIKRDVGVWWTSGAQNAQILQNGEVDMSDGWSARINAAIDGGAKLTPVWQGLYSVDGWAAPKGGPKTALAKEFIRFCMRPDRQAEYSTISANGPSNRKAFDLIPPERARLLATFPANFAGLAPLDSSWWSQKNRQMVRTRIEEWLQT